MRCNSESYGLRLYYLSTDKYSDSHLAGSRTAVKAAMATLFLDVKRRVRQGDRYARILGSYTLACQSDPHCASACCRQPSGSCDMTITQFALIDPCINSTKIRVWTPFAPGSIQI